MALNVGNFSLREVKNDQDIGFFLILKTSGEVGFVTVIGSVFSFSSCVSFLLSTLTTEITQAGNPPIQPSKQFKVKISQNKNIEDIGCNATEGNDKDNTTCNDTNESVSMHMGSNIIPETEVSEPANNRLKYVVWNHFEAIYIDGLRRFAKCKYCNKQMTGRPNDGTTHLKDHFKICPRRVTKDIRQHILVQEQTAKDGKTSLLSNYNFSAESSRDDLAKMIILHDYPLSIVEHHGFRKYSNGLQPLFKVPCRATIKSDIMKIYETKKGCVLRYLEENESKIALTSDMWTAGNQNKGYMALTAHYIDANWNFLHVPSPHTADAFSQVMIECFMDWNIDNKLSTLTLDNCSTNDALVDRLLDGFSMIEKAIKNVRDSVSFWTCSPKRAQDFRLIAQQLGVDCERELVLDCKTRWNSVYTMLNVALEYKDVFTRLSKKEKNYVSLPSEEEWRMVTDVCDKLGLFYRVTETFSGTKYPTSNMFFPLICDIKLSIKSCQDDQNYVIRNMASSMLLKFDKYWRVIHDMMSVAIVLDPRYKLKLINYFFPKIYGVDSKDEDEGFDILMWWKCNGAKFPIMQRIARDVLTIPISIVASESAFSMSGNKVTKQRSRLKSQTIGALMCSQSWLRKEIEDKKHREPKGFDQTIAYNEDVDC
ncbi:zinc finger BED domain-containing protein RICESLEEPER 2-like [Cynara cardunculus var. scolymus]|uniref:zinc finger BED domain-containing protein RICESLEEPER 2-like n=1 Tax=Cynara cardunculus var. scolymus TaxID=59895 RepID=UPI000D623EEA|nr:zinc finger BED domain-containing protein RICESLEEPER 2-like [Cynara cardunculus var. scolymus]